MSALSIINARIIDPASGYDQEGTLRIEEGFIVGFGPDAIAEGKIIDAKGLILSLIHI